MKERVLVLMLSALCATAAHASGGQAASADNTAQTVYRAASHEVVKGSADRFTGDVQAQRLFPTNATTRYVGAYVTFQPGARSAWHSHPAGQHIVVTSGRALVGARDGTVIQLDTGDALWCPPGVDHWHGATADTPMTHLVVTSELDGKNSVWKEHVTDEQYRGQR